VKRNAKLTVRVERIRIFVEFAIHLCSSGKKNIESRNVEVSDYACHVQGCYNVRIGRFEFLIAVWLESSLQRCYAVWIGKHLPAF
jgi:hypothetical protein